MRRLLPFTVILLALLSLAGQSCSDDSCYDNGSSLPLAALYVGESQQTVTGLTIMGIGAPGDSLLADASALSEVYLPLRASATTTSYLIQRSFTSGNASSLINDTLTIDYQPVEYFHSTECGAMFNFNLKKVTATSHGIDSVVVLNTLVTNSHTPSLRIHFTDINP